MARTLVRQHVLLSFDTLSDAERQSILAGVTQLAPTSALYAGTPAIQASFAALVKKGATLTSAGATVAADKQKLKADTGSEVAARTDFDVELRTLATLTEAGAKTPSDITSMGFHDRPPTPTAKLAPATPTSIDVKMPVRGHGVARVVAVYAGTGRPHFVAQWSPDPVGPATWVALVGAGKTRLVAGASGTRVWVRFASLRGQLQSDWCTPVLVTIP
jgi:hypothetical protein